VTAVNSSCADQCDRCERPACRCATGGLSKNFRVTERANLQFRWENFNIFNITNLSHFVTSGTDAGDAAGKIFDIAEPMRNMQFALRLNF
jgi:hypothetical protein